MSKAIQSIVILNCLWYIFCRLVNKMAIVLKVLYSIDKSQSSCLEINLCFLTENVWIGANYIGAYPNIWKRPRVSPTQFMWEGHRRRVVEYSNLVPSYNSQKCVDIASEWDGTNRWDNNECWESLPFLCERWVLIFHCNTGFLSICEVW